MIKKLNKNIFFEFSLNSINTILSVVSAFLINIFLFKNLGNDFDLYIYATAFYLIINQIYLQIINDITYNTIRCINGFFVLFRKQFLTEIILALIFSIIWLSAVYFFIDDFKYIFSLLTFNFFLQIGFSLNKAIFYYKKEDVKRIKLEFIFIISLFFISYYFIVNYGLLGGIISLIFAEFIKALLFLYYNFERILLIKNSHKRSQFILRKSFIKNVLQSIADNGIYLITYSFPEIKNVTGILKITLTFRSLFLKGAQLVWATLNSRLYSHFRKNSWSKIMYVFKQTSIVFLLSLIFYQIIFYLFGNQILILTYGKETQYLKLSIMIIILSGFFRSLWKPVLIYFSTLSGKYSIVNLCNLLFLILLFFIPILKLSSIHQLISLILLIELLSLLAVVIFHKHILNYFRSFY
jgi:hypothetical protein